MVLESLRQELLALQREDLAVRQELLDAGLLGGHYVRRMEAVHVRNAARLRELILLYGWPDEYLAGKDGAEAAWLIAQHAIGEPAFQRQALGLVETCALEGRVPKWHAAFLEDRIALQEDRPQRYGTQWVDDQRDGRARPWTLSDPERVNQLRAEVGLGPLAPVPEPGPELQPQERAALEETERWWRAWRVSKGWSSR